MPSVQPRPLTVVRPADQAGWAAAAAALAAGSVVVVPTDTVYGVAVDPRVVGATDRLFAAKRRPRDVPLAVLVGDSSQAWSLTVDPPPPAAVRLAARWWPGALTLVVPRRPAWNADLGDDRESVGLRCPAHTELRALCRSVGPLATTSANLHGLAVAVDADEVARSLGAAIDLVLDGGKCAGEPSTVVDCFRTSAGVSVIRAGAVAEKDILSPALTPGESGGA